MCEEVSEYQIGDLVWCTNPWSTWEQRLMAVYLGSEEDVVQLAPSQWMRDVCEVWFLGWKESTKVRQVDVLRKVKVGDEKDRHPNEYDCD